MGVFVLGVCIIVWMLCLGIAAKELQKRCTFKYWVVIASIITIGFFVLGFGIFQFFHDDCVVLFAKFAEKFWRV